MSILKINDTIGLISCSNGLNENLKSKIDELVTLLTSLNLNVSVPNALYRNLDGSTLNSQYRAKELMNFYRDKDIKAIFDLSARSKSFW